MDNLGLWVMILLFSVVYGLIISGFVRPILKGKKVTLPSDSVIGYIFFIAIGGLWLLGIVGANLFPNNDFFTSPSAPDSLKYMMNIVGFNFLIFAVLYTLGLCKKVLVIRS